MPLINYRQFIIYCGFGFPVDTYSLFFSRWKVHEDG